MSPQTYILVAQEITTYSDEERTDRCWSQDCLWHIEQMLLLLQNLNSVNNLNT